MGLRLESAVLLGLAAAATFFDLRSRRIPNALVLPVFLFALALNWALGLAGMAVAAAVFVPLWLLKGAGAGDVKLMSTAGALLGPVPWLIVFVFTAVVNGLWAGIILLRQGRAGWTARKPFAPALLIGVLLWLWAGSPGR